MLNRIDQKKIVEIINEKIPGMKCPMCSHKNFVLGEGFFNNNLQKDFSGFSIGGPSIPSVPIICKNCGFISQHALGVLGFLSEGKAQTESK